MTLVCKFIELPSIQKMNWLVWIPYCQGKETMRLMGKKMLSLWQRPHQKEDTHVYILHTCATYVIMYMYVES